MTEHDIEPVPDQRGAAPPEAEEPIEVLEDGAPVEPAEGAPITAEQLGIELPDDPAEAIETLLGELLTARHVADGYLDQLKRKAAEFDNFRKRTLREQASMRELASERLAAALLPALDSFDAALALPVETETEQKLLGGMRGTYSQLMDALAREGLEVLPGVGAAFDPSIHEAVSAPPQAAGPLVVEHEVRRGYRLKDKVLRAALVALTEGPPEADDHEPRDRVRSEP